MQLRSIAAWIPCLMFACAFEAPPASTPDDPPAIVDMRPPPSTLDSEPTRELELQHRIPMVEQSPFEVWRHREPIYELYVRHFSPEGNFKGVEARLPELKALGVGIVWLLPVNEIGSIVPANGGEAIDAPHGNPYAVKSYERLNPEYGSQHTAESAESDLRDLVARAHALDMRVILDWVPNHTAWDNLLITEHPDWYERENGRVKPVGDQFRWIAQLDWSNRALREYMKQVMVDWVRRFDLDGFRIDFAHHMPIEFFEDLRPALEAIKPVFLLAEAGDRRFHPVFDMTYDWRVYPQLGDIAHGHKTVSAIDDALYYHHFLPYLDAPHALQMRMTYNHDDNGNWTLRDRYREGIKTFAVLACTLPGKPMIFDGQEAGMRVRIGDEIHESAPLTHDPAIKLDWDDPENYRAFYTKLLQLFRANSALHHPGFDDFRKIDTIPGDYPYAFIRRDGNNAVLVMLNLSANDYPSVTLAPTANAGNIEGTYVELFSGASEWIWAGRELHLAPWEYRVYVRGALTARND
jgi:glycosidase